MFGKSSWKGVLGSPSLVLRIRSKERDTSVFVGKEGWERIERIFLVTPWCSIGSPLAVGSPPRSRMAYFGTLVSNFLRAVFCLKSPTSLVSHSHNCH